MERLTNPMGELTQLVAQPNYNDLTAKEKRYLIRSIRMWAEKNQTPEAIKGALFFAETHPAFKITPDAFDTQPYLFNVKNGTVDLRTGICHDHRPDDFLRTIANVEYDPDDTCPEWEAFITFALGDDPEVLRTFQQAVGYGLWGTNEAKKFFILYGPTGTGKSQVIATLQKLAGMYGMACPPKTILDRRATDSSNELVDL